MHFALQLAAGDSQHRLFGDHLGPCLSFSTCAVSLFSALSLSHHRRHRTHNFFFVNRRRIKGLRLLIAFRDVLLEGSIRQIAVSGPEGLGGVWDLR